MNFETLEKEAHIKTGEYTAIIKTNSNAQLKGNQG